jgi:hypothetical protein
MTRVFARQTRNGAAPDVARRRVDTNDRPNALQINATKGNADYILPHLPLRAAAW